MRTEGRSWIPPDGVLPSILSLAFPVSNNQHFPYRWNDLIRWRERKIKWPLANRWERCNRRASFSRNNGNERNRILSLPGLTRPRRIDEFLRLPNRKFTALSGKLTGFPALPILRECWPENHENTKDEKTKRTGQASIGNVHDPTRKCTYYGLSSFVFS